MYYAISLFLIDLLKNIGISVESNEFGVVNIKANIKKVKLNIGVGFIGIIKG